jgi:hypothetical protein
MFCCFRKLADMRSFAAYDPKIASEYLPPFAKARISLPFAKAKISPPLLQRGPGEFNDRPKKTPNISPLCKGSRGDLTIGSTAGK